MSLIDIKIEKIIAGGDGLGYVDGKAHFIPGTIPGEVVKVEILESKKGFNRCRLIEVLEPSDKRVSPFCIHYEQCGGCNLQFLSYEDQLELKKDVVLDIFKRTAGIDIKNIKMISSKEQNYRNRIQIHHENGLSGFRKKQSKVIIEIDKCPLLVDNLNNAFKTDLENGRYLFFSNGYKIFQGGVDSSCTVKINGKTVEFNPGGFFQSNLSILPELIHNVNDNIWGESVMDLYCGVGLFSAFLPESVKNIIAVEMDKRVEPFVNKNLNDRNYTFYPLSIEKYLGKGLHKKNKVDTIIVDPPRKGLSEDVRKFLIESKVKRIIYVSCDPVTMARDIKVLTSDKYSLSNFKCFDFYPFSSHVEAFGVLELV